MTLLETHNLSAGYGPKTVLHGLDLAMGEGEFVAVIGPNGSGKSTLVKCLTGFMRHSSGSVLFRGRPIGTYHGRELARELASVQQSLPEALPFRVRDFLMMGRYPHRRFFEVESAADREALGRAVEMTGTVDLLGRKLTELSGGERQRVFVARALVQGPRVIVLDEPVSHLDIAHGVRVMDVLQEMHDRGATVVTVLHDINLASEYATRIIALKDGKVFADGAPAAVVDYRTIEGLFDTVCIVRENPISGRPFTYPVPGRLRDR
jgi:iron complex transport system ATP-binding protein